MSVLELAKKLQTTKLEILPNGILLLTLNREKRRNGFTIRMSDELVEIYRLADIDKAVNVIIMNGVGDHFCVGADLSLEGSREPLLGAQYEETLEPTVVGRDLAGRVTIAILSCRKPSIAAIHGSAVGVGITMTLGMDIRIVANDTKIAFPFVRRGLAPEGCSTTLLWRLVGQTRALDWVLTGRLFEARAVADSGLFTLCVPRDQVLPKAIDYANMIVKQCSPAMSVLARALMWQGLNNDTHTAHLAESRAVEHGYTSADFQEGVASFIEKRDPQFKSNMNDRMPSFYPWWTTINVDIPGGGIAYRAKL